MKSCTLCVNYTFSTGVPFCTHCKKFLSVKNFTLAHQLLTLATNMRCAWRQLEGYMHLWCFLRHRELPGGGEGQASASPMRRGSRRRRRWRRWWRRWLRRWRWLSQLFAILLTTGRWKSQLLWGQPRWMVVSSQSQSRRSASTKSIHCNDVPPGEG